MFPDIFFISSVIKTSNNPWHHTDIRSPFTTEERFNQTLYTIESIRNLNDNTKILLVDCSDLDKDMEYTLKNKVDYYIQLYNNDEIRNICMNTKQKGYGEIMETKAAFDFIKENNIEFNRLFKISGRYYLNENFSKENYSLETFTFKNLSADHESEEYKLRPTPDSICTILYSVPYSLLNEFNNAIHSCINVYSVTDLIRYENLFPFYCKPVEYTQSLGVSGYVSILLDDGTPYFYTD
jgi:hypothetical protein